MKISGEQMPEEFPEDLHELVRKGVGAIDWISGTLHSMGVLEANAVKQEESMEKAAYVISSGLEAIGSALERIADEMAAARRMKMGDR